MKAACVSAKEYTALDIGADRAVVDEPRDLAELLAVRVAHEVHHTDVAAIGLDRFRDRDERATGLDDRR